jgi:hypothetical protein
MSAAAHPAARSVQCLVCRHLFEPTKGGQIAKYFLIRRPRQNTADARTDFNVIGA